MTDDTPGSRSMHVPRNSAEHNAAPRAVDYADAGWVGVDQDEHGRLFVVLGAESGLVAVLADPLDVDAVRESSETVVIRDAPNDAYFMLFRHPGRGLVVRETKVVVHRMTVRVLADGDRLELPSPAGHVYWHRLGDWFAKHSKVAVARAPLTDYVVTRLPLKYRSAVASSDGEQAGRDDNAANVVAAPVINGVEGYMARHPKGVSQTEIDEADYLPGTRRDRRKATELLLREGLAERRSANHVEGSAARSRSLLFLVASSDFEPPRGGGGVDHDV